MSDNSIFRSERPTLFVGIGGTGKQVLLQLRRMCLEHYGVPSLPHHGHLCIDTDTRNVNIEGQELDEFLQEVQFQVHERVDVPLEKSDLDKLYDNETNYEHVFSWFDRQLKKQGPIKDGAGQIRSFGRLAFFLNVEKIRRQIKRTLEQIRSNATVNELRDKYQIALEPSSVDVWLIFSLAGGTGAGMFLDVAYLVNECTGGNEKSRQALVLLPTAFSNDYSQRIFANAYASLMELEYYNYPDRADSADTSQSGVSRWFRKSWSREQYFRGEYAKSSVFDNTWFVGNAALRGGGSFDAADKIHLCGLMAEWLFVRYSEVAPALADSLNSAASNYTNFLTPMAQFSYAPRGDLSAQRGDAKAEIVQEFARKYSAPGLSKIYIATRQLAVEAEHRLAADVLDDWLRSSGVDARFHERLDKTYDQKMLYAKSGDALYRRLSLETANSSIADVVRQELARKCQEFRDSAADHATADLINSWMDRWFNYDKFAKETSDQTRWGVHTRTIFSQNCEAAEGQISTALQEFLTQTLQAHEERFAHAVEGLRYFIQVFRDVATTMARLEETTAAQAKNATRDIAATLAILSDERGVFTRSMVVKVAFFHIEKRAIAVLGRLVAQAAREVAERIVALIGPGRREKNARGEEILFETGLIKNVVDLRAALVQMRSRLASRQKALKTQVVSPANRKIPAPGELNGSFYVTARGRPFTEGDVAAVSSRVLDSGSVLGTSQIWAFRNALVGAKAEQFLKDLLAAVQPDLSHISKDAFDVLEIIDSQYEITPQDGGYGAMIRDAANKGSPMLEAPTQETQLSQLNPQPETYCEIARSGTADARARARLESNVRNALPADALAPQMVAGPRDTIYFVSERVGLPLVMIPHLDQYRNRGYLPHVDADVDASTRIVHTALDFEKFPDLLVLNDAELRKLVEAWKLFARAVALGIIRGDRAGGMGAPIRWSYYSGAGYEQQTWYLGALATALRDLSADGSQHFAAIQARIDEEMVKTNVERRAELVLIASLHSHKPPIGTLGWVRANQRIVEEFSAEANVRQRAHEKYADQTMAFAIEQPKGSGFWRIKDATEQ